MQCARLDVHELARSGHLKPGQRGMLFGQVQFEMLNARLLALDFPRRSSGSGEALEPIRQLIPLGWRTAHYGGGSHIFRCPDCGRNARVLYGAYFQDRIWCFGCRRCRGIVYQSTIGHRWDRSARRVEKLRTLLEWGNGGTEPIRPPGMHRRTFQRILAALAYHEAIRGLGASYRRMRDEPRRVHAHVWRQCYHRFAMHGGWLPPPWRAGR